MTTIAANRFCMAADSKVTVGGNFYAGSSKILRIGTTLVGAGGDVSAINKFLRWYMRKGKGKKPEFEKKEDLRALILTPKGLFFIENSLEMDEIKDSYFAIGAGEDYALAAMDCGKDPKGAVEIACRRNPKNTGGPIQVEYLVKGKT